MFLDPVIMSQGFGHMMKQKLGVTDLRLPCHVSGRVCSNVEGVSVSEL